MYRYSNISHVNTISIIGIMAAILTSAAFLPQVVQVYKTKETGALSLGTFIAFTMGVGLWLVYGLITRDIPIMLANGFTLPLGCYILFMKIKHR